GRLVTFFSFADNLVPGDTNLSPDVFVHDRMTGETTRVSVASDGEQGNGASGFSAISGNGRFVVFQSSATNLVPGDTNGVTDVYVHDRVTRTTTRVSVSSSGEQADATSPANTSISGDGRFIAFSSQADNLVPGDTNSDPDNPGNGND